LDSDAQLPSVVDDLEAVVELFTGRALGLGYEQVLHDLADNPPVERLRRGISGWLRSPDRDADDVVVLYFSGHGLTSELGEHYLLAADSEMEDPYGTALLTGDLARFLTNSPVRQLMIILDVCYAGQGIGDLGSVASALASVQSVGYDAGAGLWLLAAARPREEADQGAFTPALVEAIRDARVGQRQRHLDLVAVVDAVNQTFRRKDLSQEARLGAVQAAELPPFLPNPRYIPELPPGVDVATQRRLALQPADVIAHWGPRSRGVQLEGQQGWFFTGRTRALRELVSWLGQDDRRARVVIGGPGSGKSAVLSRLVTLADSAYRARAPLAAIPEETVPPVGSVDAAVLAKGKTLIQVVTELADALGLPAPPDDAAAPMLVHAISHREGRTVVVIDAVDEAAEPRALVQELLVPLAQAAHSGVANLRLLVGTRPDWHRHFGSAALLIDLDAPNYLQVEDLTQYVTTLLTSLDLPGGRGYHDHPKVAGMVAAAVAATAQPSFLIGRLVAESLRSRDDLVDVARAGWQEAFPATVGAAFDDYLARFGEDEQRVRDLLTPLAYAQGAGLPWDGLWAPLASALSGRTYTDSDIGWLLDHAGAYLLETLEHGRSVWRLYHQALTEHLLRPAREADDHRRFVETLMALTPTHGDSRDWLTAHPYVRAFLSVHAAAAGSGHLDELVSDPGFLLAAEPSLLLSVLGEVEGLEARRAAEVYQIAALPLRGQPIGQAAAYLELVARQQGATTLADAVAAVPAPRPWRARWASWRPDSAHRTIARHTHDKYGGPEWVGSVALSSMEGRPVAVSMTHRGKPLTVRLWDLISPGNEPLRVWRDDKGNVATTAIFQFNGGPLLLVGHQDGYVRVWDLADDTTEPWRTLDCRPDTKSTDALSTSSLLHLGQVDGEPLAITAFAGEVRVWNLLDENNRPVRTWKADYIASIAGAKVAGRRLVSASAFGGDVWVWDLDAPGDGPVRTIPQHEVSAKKLLMAEILGEPVVLWVSRFGSMQYSHLATAEVWHALDASPEPLRTVGLDASPDSLSLAKVDGRCLLAGAQGNEVMVWDLADAEMPLVTLRGHHNDVESIMLTKLAGRAVALSGSQDGTVRLWNVPASRLAPAETDRIRLDSVKTVAVAASSTFPLIAALGENNQISVWEGTPSRAPLRTQASSDPTGRSVHNPSSTLSAVAVGELAERQVLVTSGAASVGGYYAVGVWDLARSDAEPLRAWMTAPPSDMIAVSEVVGRQLVAVGSHLGSLAVFDLADPTDKPIFTTNCWGRAVWLALSEIAGTPALVACQENRPYVGGIVTEIPRPLVEEWKVSWWRVDDPSDEPVRTWTRPGPGKANPRFQRSILDRPRRLEWGQASRRAPIWGGTTSIWNPLTTTPNPLAPTWGPQTPSFPFLDPPIPSPAPDPPDPDIPREEVTIRVGLGILGSRQVFISSHWDENMRIWDLEAANAEPIRTWPLSADRADSIAAQEFMGRPIIVSSRIRDWSIHVSEPQWGREFTISLGAPMDNVAMTSEKTVLASGPSGLVEIDLHPDR
jgi:WD40 repeat protein